MRDKVLVVTGGSGVLGYAVAEAALAAGAFVALPGREETSKIAAQDRLLVLGGVDLTDFAAVTQAFETVVARFGKIDGLANIAGGFRWQTLADGDLSGWTDQFKMNLLTAATACKAALPNLRASQGAIVNVGSAPAKKAGAGMGAYAASKAGVLAADRKPRRGGETRGRSRQCGAADDHRYAAQPGGYAEGRFFPLGEARGHRQNHFVFVVRAMPRRSPALRS